MGYEREVPARQKAIDLSKKKAAIEAEMDTIYDSLTANDGPGLQGNLVDAEGFPRADINIVLIREQRHRFAVLKTDHRAVGAELDHFMHVALAPQPGDTVGAEASSTTAAAAAAAAASSATPPAVAQSENMEATSVTDPTPTIDATATSSATPSAPPRTSPAEMRQPFALVDNVSPKSPSDAAGLLVNDRIITFGAVSLRSSPAPHDALAALPGLLRSHENRSLDMIILRGVGSDTGVVTLTLTPSRWDGPGLLGCHVVPLEIDHVDPRYMPDVATAAALRANTMLGPN